MKIDTFIKRNYKTASPFSGIAEVKNQLLEESAIVILEEDQFFGVLTVVDLVRKPHILALDCLTSKSIIEPDHSVESVLLQMNQENTDVLPVFIDNKLNGLIFKNDIITYLSKTNHELLKRIEFQVNKLKDKDLDLKDRIKQYQQELERNIKERTQELLDIIDVKDRILHIIAHELRNPFNVILGFLNLLKRNLHKYEINKIEKIVNNIYYSAKLTYDLLVNLLDWLAAKNKTIPFNPSNIKLSALINEEAENISILAEQKQVKVISKVKEDLFAYADKNMVKTIIRNLITNAIKFSEVGKEVIISGIRKGHFIEMVVKDHGIGLASELMEKIFSEEGCCSEEGTANEAGTGIGLLICKEFVETGGGKIWIESEMGKGSEFKFTLPDKNLNL